MQKQQKIDVIPFTPEPKSIPSAWSYGVCDHCHVSLDALWIQLQTIAFF
jgi:hypothetical protein